MRVQRNREGTVSSRTGSERPLYGLVGVGIPCGAPLPAVRKGEGYVAVVGHYRDKGVTFG